MKQRLNLMADNRALPPQWRRYCRHNWEWSFGTELVFLGMIFLLLWFVGSKAMAEKNSQAVLMLD
ncbi:hypothetical protein ACWATR_34165 [Nostoc sp. UIC 10890]